MPPINAMRAVLIACFTVACALAAAANFRLPAPAATIDRVLATCDQIVVIVHHASNLNKSPVPIRMTARPEIEEMRWLIGAANARQPRTVDKMLSELPGCGGSLPRFHITTWRGASKTSEFVLDRGGNMMLVRRWNGTDRVWVQAGPAYERLCVACGIQIPWSDYE
jgi:hypothetical protein